MGPKRKAPTVEDSQPPVRNAPPPAHPTTVNTAGPNNTPSPVSSNQPATQIWQTLLEFAESHGITPDPSRLLGAHWQGEAVRTSSEINFDPTSTTIPPSIPFFVPSNILLPSGLASPMDVAKALKTSTTKNFGGSKKFGQLQFEQLESTAFPIENILTTWDVRASNPFVRSYPVVCPPFLAPANDITNPSTTDAFSVIPARVLHDLTVDNAANIVYTFSGQRIWLLLPPCHQGEQLHQPSRRSYANWARALNELYTGAGVLAAEISDKEAGAETGWDWDKALIAVTQRGGDGLYVPPGWAHCGWSVEGGIDGGVRVLPEWCLGQAVDVLESMLEGAEAEGYVDKARHELGRYLSDTLRCAESALKAGVEGATAGVERLGEVLSHGVRQGRLLFPAHKRHLVRCLKLAEQIRAREPRSTSSPHPPVAGSDTGGTTGDAEQVRSEAAGAVGEVSEVKQEDGVDVRDVPGVEDKYGVEVKVESGADDKAEYSAGVKVEAA